MFWERTQKPMSQEKDYNTPTSSLLLFLPVGPSVPTRAPDTVSPWPDPVALAAEGSGRVRLQQSLAESSHPVNPAPAEGS
jgi:hypothetical protein